LGTLSLVFETIPPLTHPSGNFAVFSFFYLYFFLLFFFSSFNLLFPSFFWVNPCHPYVYWPHYYIFLCYLRVRSVKFSLLLISFHPFEVLVFIVLAISVCVLVCVIFLFYCSLSWFNPTQAIIYSFPCSARFPFLSFTSFPPYVFFFPTLFFCFLFILLFIPSPPSSSPLMWVFSFFSYPHIFRRSVIFLPCTCLPCCLVLINSYQYPDLVFCFVFSNSLSLYFYLWYLIFSCRLPFFLRAPPFLPRPLPSSFFKLSFRFSPY